MAQKKSKRYLKIRRSVPKEHLLPAPILSSIALLTAARQMKKGNFTAQKKGFSLGEAFLLYFDIRRSTLRLSATIVMVVTATTVVTVKTVTIITTTLTVAIITTTVAVAIITTTVTVTITTSATVAITTSAKTSATVTIAMSAETVTTFATWARRLFYITFRFRQQRFAAEFQLAVLFVDSDNFHLDNVTNIDNAVQSVGTFPIIFGDVHQALFSGEEFEESTKLNNANHFGIVDLAHFGSGGKVANPLDGSFDRVSVDSRNVNDSHITFFFDGDNRVGLFLNFLNHFTTCTNNGTNEFLRNGDLLNARHKGFVVFARHSDSFLNFVEDVQAAEASLFQSLGEHFVAEAVDLDVHLASGDTVAGTRYLEVHIAQVVFVAENIAQHSPFVAFRDETHGNTCHRFADFHAGIHQSQTACTNGSHRRGTVGFEDVAHQSDGIRAFCLSGQHTFESAPSQMAVAHFATAEAAVALHFTCGK